MEILVKKFDITSSDYTIVETLNEKFVSFYGPGTNLGIEREISWGKLSGVIKNQKPEIVLADANAKLVYENLGSDDNNGTDHLVGLGAYNVRGNKNTPLAM